jgi:flagellar biogenesis protein FliO
MNCPKPNNRPRRRASSVLMIGAILCVTVCLSATTRSYAATNTFLSNSLSAQSLPDTGPSLLRVLGALALVLGLFLGGVWILRNGRFSILGQPRSARLNVLETRSLGARQAICVVAYGQERFLIGSSPAGINLLSHLSPSQEDEESAMARPANGMSFAQALSQVLGRQKPGAPKAGGPT